MSKNRLLSFLFKSLKSNKVMYILAICMALVINLQAQEGHQAIQVTGTVKDEFNVTLPGVNVRNLKTKITSVTNEKGRFSILANRGDSIAVSFIGFRTYTVAVKDEIKFNITLQAAQNSLN